MQTFNPLEYVMIDVANNFGLDKLNWQERIAWTALNIDDLESFIPEAENPILFSKAIRTLDSAIKKEPTGSLVSFDATTSGIQIMSALAGCRKGCEATNLIDTGVRRDVYGENAKQMSNYAGWDVPRQMIKHPIMTHFYGSTAMPMSIFPDPKDLKMFYATLNQQLPGATALMQIMQDAWHPDATEYRWEMPDGHIANFKVMVGETKKIEVAELGGASFSHKAYVNKPQERGLALAANIVHSIDGFIVREMYRKAEKQGWDLLTIHDSFWCHPNYAQQLRTNYNEVFFEHINMALFNNIMSQLTFHGNVYEPFEQSLNKEFLTADYALS